MLADAEPVAGGGRDAISFILSISAFAISISAFANFMASRHSAISPSLERTKFCKCSLLLTRSSVLLLDRFNLTCKSFKLLSCRAEAPVLRASNPLRKFAISTSLEATSVFNRFISCFMSCTLECLPFRLAADADGARASSDTEFAVLLTLSPALPAAALLLDLVPRRLVTGLANLGKGDLMTMISCDQQRQTSKVWTLGSNSSRL
mmetsp:Transcript_1608/g.3088  ORF Transcript_1608/g.3088 Transcript_1608/m.3088 type:complete len:206 (-) Transcript_1608:302-919(-)